MKPDLKQKIFPKDFLWGVSTASHQVEGGTHNQWSVWELAHANELAKTAKQRMDWMPNWTEIKSQATDPNNYVSGSAVDHYSRYKEDFDIAKSLNMRAFRFGIEWSRLEPREGEWNELEVDHYREYIVQLKARGLEPVLNIWHWTLPVWFEEKGGWANANNLKYFDRFVSKIATEYGASLNYVITLNEPNVYVASSYFQDRWPPQAKNPLKATWAYYNLTRAHKRAYRILKKEKPALLIGLALQLGNIQAKRPHNLLDQAATKSMRYIWNWWFLNRTSRYSDFIGLNYYFTDYFKGLKRVNPRVPLSDLAWYMEPEGLYPLLLRAWSRYKKPVIITENGLADSKDENRRWWIEESIVAIERALSEGVDIRGYFHWSLLDNFEWSDGWWPKFGLVEVDRSKGMKRTVRPSAKWFAERITKI